MWKRATDGGKAIEPPRFLAQEIGLDRYERITSPSLAAADAYWAKTDAYWAFVRKAWREQIAQRDRFVLRDEVDGKISYQHHNEYIRKLESGAAFDPVEADRHAQKAVTAFIGPAP